MLDSEFQVESGPALLAALLAAEAAADLAE
jgi:hypothetical protein